MAPITREFVALPAQTLGQLCIDVVEELVWCDDRERDRLLQRCVNLRTNTRSGFFVALFIPQSSLRQIPDDPIDWIAAAGVLPLFRILVQRWVVSRESSSDK